jgi:hypothetical protein
VREAIGLLFELSVGQLLLTADQGYTVGDGIDGVLRQISNIQGHGPKLERVTFPDKFQAGAQEGDDP